MKEEKDIVSNEFIVEIPITLSQNQYKQLNRFLNLHYLGDIDCNVINQDGTYVPKYPEKETLEFKNAVHMAYTTHIHKVKVIYDVNGNSKLELL